MFRSITLVLLCCAISISEGEFGGTGGTRFSNVLDQLAGPITSLRVRVGSRDIRGLQVRYGKEWSEYVGGPSGDLHMMELRPGEAINEVSGKADTSIHKLTFKTNLGRSFSFGVDMGTSFSDGPLLQMGSLSYISGHSSSAIDAIDFHWRMTPTWMG